MKKTYLECDCWSLDHVMRLSYFEDEPDTLYVETHLRSYGFFRRVWHAIKYVFGYRSRYGDFDEYLWNVETMAKIRDELNKVLIANGKTLHK